MLQDITKEGRALLMTIRGSESSKTGSAYQMRYSPKGGSTFSDMSKHPEIRESVPWRKDGKKSDAAGAYQFLSSTWKPIASKYGLNDFSPSNQDKGAWILAQRDYKAKTGKDLQQALETGQIDSAFKALSSTWTSLPSGKEANKMTGKAYDTYKASLGVDGLATGAAIMSNPLGYAVGKMQGVNPTNTIVQPITESIDNGDYLPNFDSLIVRIMVGVLGMVMLGIGFVKMKL